MASLSAKWIPSLPEDFELKVRASRESTAKVESFLGDSLVQTQVAAQDASVRMDMLRCQLSDLRALLCSDAECFGSTVARPDIQHFLASFLHFKPKPWVSLHPSVLKLGEPEDLVGIRPLIEEVTRDVLLVHRRIAVHSGLSPRQMYERWLLDVPRLLDLCAHFGVSNPHLVAEILAAVLDGPPDSGSALYLSDLRNGLSHMRHVLDSHVELKYHSNPRLSKHALPSVVSDSAWILDCVLKWLFLLRSLPRKIAPLFALENEGALLRSVLKLHDISLPIIQERLRQSGSEGECCEKALYQGVVTSRVCVSIVGECLFHSFPALFSLVRSSREFGEMVAGLSSAVPSVIGEDGSTVSSTMIEDNWHSELPKELVAWEMREKRARMLAEILDDLSGARLLSELHLPKQLELFVEVGSLSRRVFEDCPVFAVCANALIREHLISEDRLQFAKVHLNPPKDPDSAMIGGIKAEKSELSRKEDMVLELCALFGDRDPTFIREALISSDWHYDACVNAILDGALPPSVGDGSLMAAERESIEQAQMDKVVRMEQEQQHRTEESAPFDVNGPRSEDEMDPEDRAIWALFGFGDQGGSDPKLKDYQRRIMRDYDTYDDEFNDAFDRSGDTFGDYGYTGEDMAKDESEQRKQKSRDQWKSEEQTKSEPRRRVGKPGNQSRQPWKNRGKRKHRQKSRAAAKFRRAGPRRMDP